MDPPIATTLLFGFLLGMGHALEADHVVAISTMVSQTRNLLRALAGSAALMLLVLTTVRTPVQGMCYLLVFGLGSIAGMLLMSSLVALPFALTAVRFQRINEAVRMSAGLTSIILGGSFMLRVGFAQGLFAFS